MQQTRKQVPDPVILRRKNALIAFSANGKRRTDCLDCCLTILAISHSKGTQPVVHQNKLYRTIVSRAPQSLLIPETINFETYYTREDPAWENY